MKQKSRLVGAVGGLFALFGLIHLLMPNTDGQPPKDELDYFVSVWLIACGIGLVLHKSWAFWAMFVGGVIGVVAAFANTYTQTQSVANAALSSGVLALMVGLPVLLVWTRRSSLSAAPQENFDA